MRCRNRNFRRWLRCDSCLNASLMGVLGPQPQAPPGDQSPDPIFASRLYKRQLFVAPRDLAIFAAPSVISLVPSGKSQMASTPSRDSMNARDSS